MKQWKRTPFTEEEIAQAKCFRCGAPAFSQWNICADGGKYRPLCKECDVALNDMVLRWMGFSNAKQKITKYKESL